MVRNKVNARDGMELTDNVSSYWEFSPPPSYHALTASVILAELIKGRFIPCLIGSTDPQDILEMLDEKLVSFHLNLGMFPGYKNPRHDNDNFRLGTTLSLAFTSPLRQIKRWQSSFASVKEDQVERTLKSPKDIELISRLEMKAFEVRDRSIYRLMREAQLIGAALFDYYNEDGMYPSLDSLADCWVKLDIRLDGLYHRYGIENCQLEKESMSKFIEANPEAVRQARLILTAAALDISRQIKGVASLV